VCPDGRLSGGCATLCGTRDTPLANASVGMPIARNAAAPTKSLMIDMRVMSLSPSSLLVAELITFAEEAESVASGARSQPYADALFRAGR
jgi:hypothetical protein